MREVNMRVSVRTDEIPENYGTQEWIEVYADVDLDDIETKDLVSAINDEDRIKAIIAEISKNDFVGPKTLSEQQKYELFIENIDNFSVEQFENFINLNK